jgi:chromosome segregation ATPase
MNRERAQTSTLKRQLDGGQGEAGTLRTQVERARTEVSSLTVQLREKEQTLSGEQQKVSSQGVQLQKKEQEVSSLTVQVSSGQKKLDSLRVQLTSKEQELDTLTGQLREKEQEVERLTGHLDSIHWTPKVSTGQYSLDTGHPDSGQVIQLDAKKRKGGQEDQALGRQIKQLLEREPGVSDRTISTRLGCLPTTVGRWRKLIEGEQSTECVNE